MARAPAGTLCFDHDNFYGFEIPEGFTADLQQALKKKKCLLLLPLGSEIRKPSNTLMIGIESLRSHEKLNEFIKKDLSILISTKQKSRIEKDPDLTTSQGLNFELWRVFNPDSELAFLGRAYYQTQNHVLVISTSIKNEDEIPLYENVFKNLVLLVKKLESKNLFPYLKLQAEKDLTSPTGRNFDLRAINSLRGKYLEAQKACGKNSKVSSAIIRLSKNGKIQNWLDENSPESLSCLGKKMVGAEGTKPPFEPFHLVLDPKSF